ncbi:phasin family protein [Polynucleobacter sp. CS-Odin-A6]|uniref:phasin family protein n=1 Tax=Polynucleobacter sp. CS-Odin-A6 TaxID=2689106 RepID=UPI001C0B5AAD|nr:phasin family protein [Polynucleobacter sp. CS-Odin-A6]MBU3621479.1 phasin family protein [Polynucleobacter sp. CS-Odin-A6]
MYQTEKLIAAQAKAIESAQELAQLAIDNAKAITDIHFDVTKEAVTSTQAKAAHILRIKDAKEALELFRVEEAQEVISEVSAVQSRVNKVISKSNKEVVIMIESAIDDSQAELRQMAKEITGMAPVGSASAVTAFDYMFDAALQSFDQAYAVSKDAYTSFEKTMESTLSAFQGQLMSAKKTAAKKTKAIAA